MNELGAIGWSALSAAIMLLIAIIGVVVRLMDRINKADNKAQTAAAVAHAASDSITENRKEIERLETDLVNHRVEIAKEYVSKPTLESLENRIVDAINRLGDRFDKLLAATR